jgi:hypothetical protein
MNTATIPGLEGWARPLGMTRAHWFAQGRILSLCAGVVHVDGSRRTPAPPHAVDVCETCTVLLALQQEAAA